MSWQLARCRFILLITLMALLLVPASAQDNFRDVIEMSVVVGFDSFFRPDQWTPVYVALKNNGESVTGRLVIRPETSGTVVGNAFSSAIELPSGSEKSAMLHIQARSFPDSVRVELIDAEGLVRAAQDAPLFDLRPQDQLTAVVAGPNSAPPNLSGQRIGGFLAEQAIWTARNIPEQAQALESLDLLLLVNFDSEALSSGQREAIQHWVEAGGHLIFGGGASAARTAAALSDLLPVDLAGSQALEDASALARFVGDDNSRLSQRAIRALSQPRADAEVLVAAAGSPLLARRYLGAGLVDFLALDPTLEPLASWDGLGELWLKLLATRAPHPAWQNGFTQPQWGAEAVANLPGVDLLPPMQTLCLFLGLYILLIGPLNYLLLSRLRRNGWGWFTIPAVILAFALIAWTVGFNLRGSEIIVSRLTLVESFPDSDEAQLNQYVGLLSPRRASYSLTLPAGRFLAVAGATAPTSIFASNRIQTATEISQSGGFGAENFTIDGGIFANFTISGRIPKPDIRGSFTLGFDILEGGRMVSAYQGSIVNESDITLRDAVLLAEGMAFELPRAFAPGDIVTLGREQLRADIDDAPPQPNPAELRATAATGSSPFAISERNRSLKDLQGERYLRTRAFLSAESVSERGAAREQSFLASFMIDRFGSAARGSGLYLLGWSDNWSRDLELDGAGWSSVDTTLYIIELAVALEKPSGVVTLPSEYFTWTTLEREGIVDNGVDGFSLFEGQSVEFLLQPLPGLALDLVHYMELEVDRGGGYAQSLDIQLYDWTTDSYEIYGYREGDELELPAPQRFLGPGGAVRLRLHFEQGVGTARVRQIRIEQTGRYA